MPVEPEIVPYEKQPDLRLLCNSGDDDTMIVSLVANDVLFRAIEQGRDVETYIYLAPEDARRLFNWLGVYLHTL